MAIAATVVNAGVDLADSTSKDALGILRTGVADAAAVAGAPIRVAGKTADALLAEIEAGQAGTARLVRQLADAITRHLP